MDISRTRVVLRERAVIDVLDLGVRFVAQHRASYARLAAMVLPPFFGASWLLARTSGAAIAWLFTLFAGIFAGAPFTLLASRLVFEDDVRLKTVWSDTLRAFPRLVVVRLFTFFVCMPALTLFVVPGVWLSAMMLFATEVVMLERASVRLALRRCSRILRREPGPMVAATLLLAVMHSLAVILGDLGGRMLTSALLESRAPDSMWDSGWSALGFLGFWMFVPYAATAKFFIYLDVRTRSEGWDIQTRFAAIAARTVDRVRSAA